MSQQKSIVDDAEYALRMYKEGLPIEAILHRHPVSYFDPHTASVWQVVFEGENSRDAVSAIQRMGVYEAFSESVEIMLKEPKPEAYARSVASLCVQYLSNQADVPDFGMTLTELAKTLKVFLSHPTMIAAIRAEATVRLEDRIRITGSLPKEHQAPHWVEKMREVQKIVYEVFV